MMISIDSKRTAPSQGTFNHRLIQAGLLLAVFAASLMLTACPSPGGGGGTITPNGGATTTSDRGGTITSNGGNRTPPAPNPQKSEPSTPEPKAWHVTTFAGSGVSGTADGIGTAASFGFPYSIAQSGDTFYVIDKLWHSIRTIDTTTARVGTIVTPVSLTGDYADGAGTSARFNGPSSIVAADGNTLYVADLSNHRIREVRVGADAAATQVSLLAGSGTAGHADDAGAAAQFNSPIGLALSGTMLYVADRYNHRIRAVDLASPEKTVSTIAGSVTAGYADGAGSTAQFRSPSGLAVDASGTTLYVADRHNHRIRAIDLASTEKTVSTVAGSVTAGYADGVGITAQFNQPIGLALSGTMLYVTDNGNHRIRAVDLAGPEKTVSTIAGNGIQGSTNGIGTAAQFRNPFGIAVMGSTLYVTSDVLIRKLEYREIGS